MGTSGPVSIIRRLITSVLLVALLLFGGARVFKTLAGMRKESEKKVGSRLPELVRSATATRGAYQEQLTAYGRARALRRTARSAEVGGVVRTLDERLEIGAAYEMPAGNGPTTNGADGRADHEDHGPVILTIDDADQRNEKQSIEADLLRLEAELEKLRSMRTQWERRLALSKQERDTAVRELERIADLVERKKLPKSDLDKQQLAVFLRDRAILDSESALVDADASLKVIKSQAATRAVDLDIVERKIRRATVRLPTAGVVEARNVSVGDVVAKGTPLFTIVDLSIIEVPLQLPARTYGRVKVGTEVRLFNEDLGTALPNGRIARIAPRIDERQRVYDAFVEIKGTPTSNPVAPGTFVRAVVPGFTYTDVIVVRREAFVGEDLYVVKPVEAPEGDEPAEALARGERFVEAERRTPEVTRWFVDVALVKTGLEAGERYAVSNLESVSNSALLRIIGQAEEGR
jgi:RND family efflux transporter MFP subunit